MPQKDDSHHILSALAELNSNMLQMQSNFETLSKLITGNGHPEKGIIIKLDRLEQESVRRERWTKAAVAAALTALATTAVHLIKSIIN